jgi:phosphoribosylamine--glycine ligase
MKKEEHPYEGFLFIGLMNVNGEPYVIEYNCRMGDPETEAVFPRLNIDFLEWFKYYHEKRLNEFTLNVDPRHSCTVVLASEGYPDAYEKNKILECPTVLPENIFAFCAGVKEEDGKWLTNGGRVMAVTALGDTLEEARNSAYREIEHVRFENKYFRKDIGLDLLH